MLPLIIYFQYEAPAFSFPCECSSSTTGNVLLLSFSLIFLLHTVFREVTSWMIQGVLWISRQSYGMLTIGHVPFLWVLLFYFMMGLWIWKKMDKIDISDQSGLCYHDHFDMDSNGKKKESGIS